MIEIKNLNFKYIREYYALYDINLTIADGENIAFVGEEGSGKTTLLRVLTKLEKYDSGEVYVNEINLKKLDFKNDVSLGYVALNPVFFENKSVYENLKYVLKERKYKASEIEEKVNNALIEYSLEKYRNQKVKELTLLEKYVVALVRLSLRPLNIVMIDDIFKNCNEEENEYLRDLIKKLFDIEKVTLLIATDNAKNVEGLYDRIVNFKNGTIE